MEEISDSRSASRFWSRVEKTPGCWLWRGTVLNDGYGQYGATGERRAHRRAWFLTYGPIPDGMQVCHRCDVPLCVNPDHLFLGTPKDNMADRDRKGRQAKGKRNFLYGNTYGRSKAGENHHAVKLTSEQVTDIRRRYAAGGVLQRVLAAECGVSQRQISRIVRGERWS